MFFNTNFAVSSLQHLSCRSNAAQPHSSLLLFSNHSLEGDCYRWLTI